MDSIAYYNKNSKEFFDRTINADLQEVYQKFLNCIPAAGRILDAGCGVGRDSKFFLSNSPYAKHLQNANRHFEEIGSHPIKIY